MCVCVCMCVYIFYVSIYILCFVIPSYTICIHLVVYMFFRYMYLIGVVELMNVIYVSQSKNHHIK